MKTSDISNTPLVRKYGVRGAKLFARFWFPLLYILLIAPTAALWSLAPELATEWKRIFFGCLVSGLTVLAASLLADLPPFVDERSSRIWLRKSLYSRPLRGVVSLRALAFPRDNMGGFNLGSTSNTSVCAAG